MANVVTAVHLIQTRNEKGDLVEYHPGEALAGFDADTLKGLIASGAAAEGEVLGVVTEALKPASETVFEAPSKQDLTDNRVSLETRAAELGVQFRSNISDEKLAEKVAEAEAKTLTE